MNSQTYNQNLTDRFSPESDKVKKSDCLSTFSETAAFIQNYTNGVEVGAGKSYKSGNWYYNRSGVITAGFSGDKLSEDYIEVKPNTYYIYIGKIDGNRSIVQYNSSNVFISVVDFNFGYTLNVIRFKTSATTKYIRACVHDSTLTIQDFKIYELSDISQLTNWVFWQLNDALLDVQNRTGAQKQSAPTANFPSYIFLSDNDSSVNRGYFATLFPESVQKFSTDNVLLNNGRILKLQTNSHNSATKESATVGLVLGGIKYADSTANVTLLKTKISNGSSKSVVLSCIGDSISQTDISKPNGDFIGGWGYGSIAKELSIMDSLDLGGSFNFLLSGTMNNKSRSFSYGGSSHAVRAFNEGRGSWCAATYLNHAVLLTGYTTPSTDYTVNGYASWDMLGLTTIQGRAFSASDADKLLIMNGIVGKNAWDYSAYIWDYLKLRSGWTGGSGSYTGSVGDKAAIDAMMNSILDNPDNPFYSKTKAQTVGSTNAFSYATYLSRYKTLADDGITRLVVGSTAGSKVTNATDYDVCTPTHVLLFVGENDRWHFPATSTNIKNTLTAIEAVIRGEYPSVIVGFASSRPNGSYFPDRWSDIGVPQLMSYGGDIIKRELTESLKTTVGSISTQVANKKYLLPFYYVHDVISSYQEKEYTDASGNKVVIQSTDAIHPGYATHFQYAYQLISWIYYTL